MNTNFDTEKYCEAKYKEACEALYETERKRLTEAHLKLDNICNRISAGDRKSMLELIETTADTLLAFNSLTPELQASLANGLKEVVNILRPSKGFLPRRRGEVPDDKKSERENYVNLTAMRVEFNILKFGLTLEEARGKVANDFGMGEDLIHKNWKKGHYEAKRQFELISNVLDLCGADNYFPQKKKVR